MLARIKNAYTTNMDTVVIPFSKFKGDIATILDEEGYIRGHEIRKDEGIQGVIKVHLKYNKNGNCAISGLKRISKPGLRVYAEKYSINFKRRAYRFEGKEIWNRRRSDLFSLVIREEYDFVQDR